MVAIRVYTAEVTREGGKLLATVTDLEGVSTWAESLSELDVCVREAIAVAEDLPAGAEAGLKVQWGVPGFPPGSIEELALGSESAPDGGMTKR